LLKLKLSAEAAQFIASVGGKQAGQISLKIFELLKNPTPGDSEALRGTTGNYRRADAGECRIVYRVFDDELEVPLVGRRKDDEIYKQVKRKGL
jgi:mRNA interferase RelE/StbE